MSGTFALYRYPCVTSASCTCHVLRGAAVSLEPAGSDPNPRCIHGIRDLVDGTGKKRHWSTVSASWWTGPEKSHICPRNPRSGGRSAVFKWPVHEMLVLVDESLICRWVVHRIVRSVDVPTCRPLCRGSCCLLTACLWSRFGLGSGLSFLYHPR